MRQTQPGFERYLGLGHGNLSSQVVSVNDDRRVGGRGGGRICNNQFCNVGQDIEVYVCILGVFWLAWSAGAVLCVHSGEVVIHKHN